MQKNMLMAIGGGGIGAAISMAFVAGSPGALLLVYITMLPLYLVAFSMGFSAATVACIAGMVIAAGLGGVINGLSFGVLHALPAWIVSWEWLASVREDGTGQKTAPYSLGRILGLVSVLAAVIILTGTLFIGSGGRGVLDVITSHIGGVFSAIGLDTTEPEVAQFRDSLVALFPGAMGVAWIAMTIVNALIAQRLLKRFGKNITDGPSFRNLSLPQWIALPMIGAAVAALAFDGDMGFIALNMTIILAVPFFFLGLSVVHWAIHRIEGFRIPLLIGLYMILLIFGWALVIVAALGMAEQWWGVRNRVATN